MKTISTTNDGLYKTETTEITTHGVYGLYRTTYTLLPTGTALERWFVAVRDIKGRPSTVGRSGTTDEGTARRLFVGLTGA